MSASTSLRSVRLAPFTCAVVGGFLVLGTVVGQAGHASSDDERSDPMAGMNHDMGGMHASGGESKGMDMADMSGHDMANMSDEDMANMPGHDMANMSDEDMANMPGHDMSQMGKGGAPASAAAAMDMNEPGMAAQMRGGFHSICTTARSCMVVFDKDASGTASVLGLKAHLSKLSATTANLRVGGRSVVLRKGKTVVVRGVQLKIIRIDANEVAIRVTKAKAKAKAE